jgi:hypothetical protein
LTKAQHGAKRHVDNKDSFEESSSEGTESSKGLTSSGTNTPSHRISNKRKYSKNQGPEKFKKSRPLAFDGEIKKGEEEEIRLLGLMKYFRVHGYSKNLKPQISIFNLNGKASIWSEDLRNVKGIQEKKLSWKQFEKHFKKKYLSERYHDERTNNFYELKLGQLTIDEYISKFLELLRYLPYIKEEKAKMQRFLNGIPQSFRDRVEFDEPKTLEDTIHKARYCYEKIKHKEALHTDWKKKGKLGFKKKGFKPSKFKNHGKCPRMSLPTKSVYEQNFPSQGGNNPFGSAPGKTDNAKKEPLKCWGCGEEHLLRDYPHRHQNSRSFYNIQEATTVNDVARGMLQIHATLEIKQADHQASVVEMEGMIFNHIISI